MAQGLGEKDPGDAGQGPGTKGNGLLRIFFSSPDFLGFTDGG